MNSEREKEDAVENRKEKSVQFSNETKSCRYAYSAPIRHSDDKFTCVDACSWNIEGEIYSECRDCNVSNIGQTDSEITVLRVKMDNSFLKTAPENNWNMKDEGIPGDGTHLGESPSLVNLATLVIHTKDCYEEAANCNVEGREYLVPLSSWDPADKRQNSNDEEIQSDNIRFEETVSESEQVFTDTSQPNNEEKININRASSHKIGRKHSLSFKVANFFRKHLTSKKKNSSENNLQTSNSTSSVTKKF